MLKFKKLKTTEKSEKIDPLYTIFEQHLFNFNDSNMDRKSFVSGIIQEYTQYLRKSGVLIPAAFETQIFQELAEQVNTMLVKKIYGCLSVDEYSQGVPSQEKKRAQKRYEKLKTTETSKSPVKAPRTRRLNRTN